MEVSLDEWDGGISPGCFAHPGPRTFWLGGGCEGARGIGPVGDVAGEGRCTQPGTDSAHKHASTACKHTSPTVCTSKYHHQFEALAPAQNVLGYGVGSAGLDPVPIGKLPTHELVSPSHPAPPPGASSYAILVPSARTPCTLLVPSLYRSTSLTALSPRLSTPHELVCPIWLYEVSAFVHAQVRVFQCVFVSVGWMRGAQTPAGVCGFRLAVRAFGSTSRCYIEDTYFALITVITVRRSLRMTQGQSPCGWWPETTFLMLSNGLVCGARYSCASV